MSFSFNSSNANANKDTNSSNPFPSFGANNASTNSTGSVNSFSFKPPVSAPASLPPRSTDNNTGSLFPSNSSQPIIKQDQQQNALSTLGGFSFGGSANPSQSTSTTSATNAFSFGPISTPPASQVSSSSLFSSQSQPLVGKLPAANERSSPNLPSSPTIINSQPAIPFSFKPTSSTTSQLSPFTFTKPTDSFAQPSIANISNKNGAEETLAGFRSNLNPTSNTISTSANAVQTGPESSTTGSISTATPFSFHVPSTIPSSLATKPIAPKSTLEHPKITSTPNQAISVAATTFNNLPQSTTSPTTTDISLEKSLSAKPSGSFFVPSTIKNKTIQEIAAKFSADLEHQLKTFKGQAVSLIEYDLKLINNSEEIAKLIGRIGEIDLLSKSLDQQLDFISGQQNELEHILTCVEEQISGLFHSPDYTRSVASVSFVDEERGQIYEHVKNIDAELNGIEKELMKITKLTPFSSHFPNAPGYDPSIARNGGDAGKIATSSTNNLQLISLILNGQNDTISNFHFSLNQTQKKLLDVKQKCFLAESEFLKIK